MAEDGPRQRVPDRGDPAVHHVGRRDDIGAGPRVGERLVHEDRQRLVVVDRLGPIMRTAEYSVRTSTREFSIHSTNRLLASTVGAEVLGAKLKPL